MKKTLAENERQLELQRIAALEEEKNRRELAEFELKFAHKKKHKERKAKVSQEKKDSTSVIIAVVSILIILIAALMYFLMFTK